MYAIAWGLSVVLLSLYFQLWGLVYIAGTVTVILILRQLVSLVIASLSQQESKVKREPRPTGPLAKSYETRERKPLRMR
jgi:hypothetical protein